MTCTIEIETLSAWQAGDLSPSEATALRNHSVDCETCRARLSALDRLSDTCAHLQRAEASAGALLAARRVVADEMGTSRAPSEIMTLDEVADYLRVPRHELETSATALPAFEFAGHIRVRRAALVAWVEQRERMCRHATEMSWAAEDKQIYINRGAA